MKQNSTVKLQTANCSKVSSKHGQAPVHSQTYIMTGQILKSTYNPVFLDIFALTHVLFEDKHANLFSVIVVKVPGFRWSHLFMQCLNLLDQLALKCVGGDFGARFFTDVPDHLVFLPATSATLLLNQPHSQRPPRLRRAPVCSRQLWVGGSWLSEEHSSREVTPLIPWV